MDVFDYNQEKTIAEVKFLAHKFPYTDSVYYQCNVRLCLKADGCEDTVSITSLRRTDKVVELGVLISL